MFSWYVEFWVGQIYGHGTTPKKFKAKLRHTDETPIKVEPADYLMLDPFVIQIYMYGCTWKAGYNNHWRMLIECMYCNIMHIFLEILYQ